jgi:N-hydroxyarylamine O-acetyltransferase
MICAGHGWTVAVPSAPVAPGRRPAHAPAIVYGGGTVAPDAISDAAVDAYLARLGLDHRPRPTAEALARLHLAHLERIPFENLSVHLDEPIVLDPAALVDKLTRRGRGGFCYELNGAFASLLSTLGFEVSLLAARVHDEGALGPPFDHLLLRVELDRPWLVDVGFGDNFDEPLLDGASGPQRDRNGSFEIVEVSGGECDLRRDGEPQYRFDTRPRQLGEFAETCRWQQTSPDSGFTRRTVCSRRLAGGGRVTIRGATLAVRTDDDRREQALAAPEALAAAYAEHFAIALSPAQAARLAVVPNREPR